MQRTNWICLGSVALFLSFGISSLARQPLTFEERVKAQEAIERVYYNHRIWPKENPGPKPPFEKLMPREALEAGVDKYTEQEAERESCLQSPILREHLDVEVNRMREKSQAPETLEELFAALGHDSTLIAECLALPILLLRVDADTNHSILSSEMARPDSLLATMADGYENSSFSEPQLSLEAGCTPFLWTSASLSENAPSARSGHTAVWTGAEMIVWGGGDDTSPFNTGGRYNPATDTWVPINAGLNCPEARTYHTAIWTGLEMIVWGGYDFNWYLYTGGLYNPTTDTWADTSIGANCPTARIYQTAVWTGNEMIVWGGHDGVSLNTGGRYSPSTDSWVATSIGTNLPTARYYHTAVWTGNEMIVWGGVGSASLNTGGRYSPSTDSWVATSTGANCPTVRRYHTAVWTGSEMIVWGGYYGASLNTGGRYSPSTDSWVATSIGTNVPIARYHHTTLWTGTEMIVWGGNWYDGAYHYENTGGRYNPALDSWAASYLLAAPSSRSSHTATWTGMGMIVWGGWDGTTAVGNGGVYTGVVGMVGPNPSCAPATLECRVFAIYRWYRNGSPIAGATTQTYTALVAGNYTVEVTDAFGCKASSAPFIVNSPPTSPVISAPSNGCSSVVMTTGTYSSYQWAKDGVPISGATTQSYEAFEGGNYSVTITNTSGCQAISSPQAVTITPLPSIFGDYLNVCPSTVVSLDTDSGYISYQWLYNGSPIPRANQQAYSATVSGNYMVTATDSAGCSKTSLEHPVFVDFCPMSEVSPQSAFFPARLRKDASSPTGYYLFFQRIDSTEGFNVYEGAFGDWYSHQVTPSTMCHVTYEDLLTGELRVAIMPSPGNHYYLVTAYAGVDEGPSGFDSTGTEIPASQSICAP